MEDIPQAGDGGGTPIKIGGGLTIETADDLRRRLIAAVDGNPNVVCDFADVDTCDTAGLQLLYSLRITALQRGHAFHVTAISSAIRTAAEAVGLSMQVLTASQRGTGDAL